jgi:hypothetical protein
LPELFNSETGLLTLTNAVLGLAVLISLLAVGRVVFQELRVRAVKRVGRPMKHLGQALNLESLGITMPDGGDPINEMIRQVKRTTIDPDDPPNIIRSEN